MGRVCRLNTDCSSIFCYWRQLEISEVFLFLLCCPVTVTCQQNGAVQIGDQKSQYLQISKVLIKNTEALKPQFAEICFFKACGCKYLYIFYVMWLGKAIWQFVYLFDTFFIVLNPKFTAYLFFIHSLFWSMSHPCPFTQKIPKIKTPINLEVFTLVCTCYVDVGF